MLIKVKNRGGVLKYVKSDWVRYCASRGIKPNILNLLMVIILGKPPFIFNLWFRLASMPNVFYPIARIMHLVCEKKYGVLIHKGTKIGYGFLITHAVGVIVNQNSTLGNNCTISQFTTIGGGNRGVPTIGDNVTICANATIIGNVKVGNNAVIGAGAVVVKDVPENAVVAGNPARILYYNPPKEQEELEK